MATTTQSSLDAALVLGKWLYVFVLRLDLAAVSGQHRHRLESAVGALATRLADASACRSRRRVLSLLDEAMLYAKRVELLLAVFDELGALPGEGQAGTAARQRVAELGVLLDRLLGTKPDFRLGPEEESFSTPSSPPPSSASVDDSTPLGPVDDAAIVGGWVGEPWLPQEVDMPGNGLATRHPPDAVRMDAGIETTRSRFRNQDDNWVDVKRHGRGR